MKHLPLYLATVALLGLGSASAATISWNPAVNMAADTDVVSSGVLKYAYTWNSTARTVNGTTFAVAGTNITTPTGGNVTLAGFNAVNQTAFNITTGTFSSLSTAYKGLVNGAAYTSANTTATVTLNGLTVGSTYRVQVWSADPRSGTTTTRAAVLTSGANTMGIDYNVGNVGGGVGQSVTGTFTADAATQSFTITGSASNQINALQLRTVVGKWGGDVDGNWDTTTANFSGLTFAIAGAAGSVEFTDVIGSGGAVTRTNITIQPGGITGANALFTNASVAYSLNSADATGLTGTFAINKSGAGSLTLAGPNTNTADTVFSGGSLNLAHGSALQNTSLNFTGGLLNFIGLTDSTFGGLKGNQALHLVNDSAAAVALTIGGNNLNTTFSGAIDGAGSLTKTGTGTLTLSGAATHTGGTTVTSGTLAPTGSHAGPITVTGGSLTYLNNALTTPAVGGLAQSGGRILLDVGTAGADSLNVAGNVTFSGGTMEFTPLSQPTPNVPYTLVTYSGTLTGLPTIINPTRFGYTLDPGTGTNSAITITFSGSNAELVWSGAVDAEWSVAAKNNWLNGVNPDQFYSLDNVTFDDTATQNFAVTIPAPSVVAGTIKVNNSVNDYTLGGSPITGVGGLTKDGSSSLTLSNTNTYTGGTTITNGTVTAATIGSLGTGAVTNNGTLNLTATGAGVTYTGISSSLSGTGTVNVSLSTGTVTTLFNGNNAGFTGTMNIGVGAVAGAGKIQLNGQTAAGATYNALANATIYVATAVTQPATAVLYGGDMGETLGQLRVETATWSGPVILAGDITTTNDATVGANSGSGTISGNISETGGTRALVKGGAGTTVLTGDNSYTGTTTLNAGRLHLGSNTALGTGSAGVTIKTATALQLNNGVTISGKTATIAGNGFSTTDFQGSLQVAANGTATWDGGVVLNDAVAQSPRIGGGLSSKLTITGPISNGLGTNLYISSGVGGTTSATAGTVVLAGQSTYTGITAIFRGILQMGIANALPATTLLDIDAAAAVADVATVDLNGFNQVVLGLQDSATTSLNSVLTNTSATPAVLTINNTADYVFDGVVTGAVGFIKQGTGKQTLNGANTNTGNTTVQGGTLSLATASLADTSQVLLFTGGLLDLTHGLTDTVDKLEIDGVGQPAGLYGSVGSGATFETLLITGTGKLLVVTGSVADAFTNWINNYLTLTPAQKTKGADPDGDGLTNFAEFAFGTDPTAGGSVAAYWPSLVDTNNDQVLDAVFTVAVRDGAAFNSDPQPTATMDGVIYKIQGSVNLTDFGQVGAPTVEPLGVWDPGVGGPETPGGYQWQRFRLVGGDGVLSRGFFRATATTTP